MNTQRTNHNNPEENVELRIRILRTLWFALFASIGLYFMLTVVVGRSEDAAPNNTLSLALLVAAMSTTLISFLIKSKLLARAVDQQQVLLVQQAYIVSWAITEAGALLGLVDFFATGDRYYYLPFVIAGVAQLLHFPRREHVLNAAYKSSGLR